MGGLTRFSYSLDELSRYSLLRDHKYTIVIAQGEFLMAVHGDCLSLVGDNVLQESQAEKCEEYLMPGF